MKVRIGRQAAPGDFGRRRGLERVRLRVEERDAVIAFRSAGEEPTEGEPMHEALSLVSRGAEGQGIDVVAPVRFLWQVRRVASLLSVAAAAARSGAPGSRPDAATASRS